MYVHAIMIQQNGGKLNVVVTGANRGFGRSLCNKLAGKGHRVIGVARKPYEPEREGIVPVTLNVGNPRAVERMVAFAFEKYDGRIDAVVNNAAQSNGFWQFSKTGIDEIEEMAMTNLVGPLVSVRSLMGCVNGLQVPCHVFNLTGAGADGVGTPYYSVYGATKCGLAQFTRSVRAEIEDHSVMRDKLRVHVLSPGMMPTPLLLENLPQQQLAMLRHLYEEPDAVADAMADAIESVVVGDKRSVHVPYFTLERCVSKLMDRIFAR